MHRAPASYLPNVDDQDDPTVAMSRATLPPPPGSPFAHSNPFFHASVPPAPNSLAPMAMSAEVDASCYPRSRSEETVVIRPRSKVTLGVAIAIAGAMFGGVVGIALDARLPGAVPHVAVAAMAAPQPVAVTNPEPLPAAPKADAPAPAPIVAAQPATSLAASKVPAAIATPTPAKAAAKVAPTLSAPKPEAKVAIAKPAPPVVKSTPAPPVVKSAPASKPAPAPKPTVAKAERPSAKATAGESDESMKMYSAASAETSLTLGGSN